MFLSEAAIPLLVAGFVSLCLTPFAMKLGIMLDIIDRPNERKVSRREKIPLIGGLSIFTACMLGLLSASSLDIDVPGLTTKSLGFLSGGFVLVLIGLWDDRFYLTAWQKIPFQILACCLAIASGFSIDYITNPFTTTTLPVPFWLSWPLTLLWILLVTNAMNLIDGLDGLASGMGAIVAATLVVICWQAEQMVGVVIGLSLLGALLGFLPFNFPPARSFLGDSGAYFLGFALALVSIQGYRKEAVLTFVVPLLALAVPLIDVALSIIRRLRRGERIFSPDDMHMHHHLLRREGTHRRAVLWLYFQTTCFGLIAISFSRITGIGRYLLLFVVGALTIRLLKNLGLFSIEWKRGQSDDSIAP